MARDFGPGLRFLPQRRSRCSPLWEAPPAFTPAESRPGGGLGEHSFGPGRPPPSPLRRLGSGRGAGGVARRRGGSSAETSQSCWRAKCGSAACCLSGTVLIQLASGCAFAAYFVLLSGPGDELSLGQGRERLPPPGPPRTFSFQSGRLRREHPVRPAPGAGAYDSPGSRGAPAVAERRGAGRGRQAGARRQGRAQAPGGCRR